VSIAALGVMRGSGMKTTIARTGEKATADNFLNASLNFIAIGYFETMGMQIVAGRSLTAADKSLPARTPVVVNRAFATYFFPNQDPLGKTFGSGANTVAKDTFQIVGVATDAHYRSLREAIPATIYAPGLQDYDGPFILHIRTATRPEEIIAPVREMIRALDPQLPIIETHTLAEEVESTLWSERLVAALASIFGLLAAILAAIGIYGLLAFRVAQRTREIGIRVALGAAPSRVLALIGGQSAILAGTGVLIGVITALLVLPLARTLLYGVAPHDPATLAATAAFVAAIAAIATAIPAVRALRVDPPSALRQD
jgi:predicted permease